MIPEKTAEHAETAQTRLSLRSLRSLWFFLCLQVLLISSRALAQSVTYTKDVAPLLGERCGMCHHPGGSAPFSLLTYADAKRHAAQIAKVTAERFMPPWKADPRDGPFIGQHPLSDAELSLLRRWSDAGAPEGSAAAQSAIRNPRSAMRWAEGWQLGKPDLVITLPEPYTLPAEGTDAFHIFVLPIPVDRGRFVRGLEFRPGNARVVHHANTGSIRRRPRARSTPRTRGRDTTV